MIKFTGKNLIRGLQKTILAKPSHLTVQTALMRKFSFSCRALNQASLTEDEKAVSYTHLDVYKRQ